MTGLRPPPRLCFSPPSSSLVCAMNKRCYRVVFNKTRGLLMAVCELARSHGAAASGGLALTSSAAHLPVARLRTLAFAVLLLSGVELILIPSTQAQIVADRSAPRSQQPVVLNTASGLPQVNITTPSAAGVSRNTYTQFDVNKPGAILNNARSDVQTQLGGWVQRNPNLATGTARVILNEVNSANPSLLRGYVEVAGDRAQVVIANPSGITCDGCGFINASRTTLTTGTAIMNGGNLDGFVVRRGTVTVQGDGLDASQSDYTHIIARAARINAGIWSRELRVTTGANRVDVDNQVIQKQDAADIAPSFSIDVAQLTTDVVLLVEKDVVLPDGSTTKALVPQLYVRLKDGDINGHGALLAADSVNLKITDAVNNSGTIAGRNLLTIDAATINNNGGRLTAKDATVVAALDVNNIGGTIDAGDKLSVSAGRDLNLVSTTRDSATDQATRTSVERVAALYVANTGGTLTATAARDINAKAAQIANSGVGGSTTLAAGNNVNLDTVAEKSTQSLTWDANNYRKEALSSEVGSSINASGDVRVMAGNDINARGLNATSDKGAISLAAVNNVNISTASSTQQIDEGHQTSGSSGMFSKKTVTTRYLVEQSQEAGSTVSGNTVSVNAGKDANVTGSNVVSTAGTSIGAGNNVNIAAASDKADNTFIRNEVTSGLFSGGSFGVTIGKQQMDNKNRTISSTAVSSTVGSTEGNVSINAGNAYAQISAPPHPGDRYLRSFVFFAESSWGNLTAERSVHSQATMK